MHIETSRFLLRDFSGSDRDAFIAYQMDPRYRRLYDFDESEGRALELFERFDAWRKQTPRQNFQVGIFEHGSSRLIGCGGLRREGTPEGPAVQGLELAPDVRGRYAAAIEIVSALIEHDFDTLGLESIIGDYR